MEKYPLQWILEQVPEYEMAEEWKETMAAQKLDLREEEKSLRLSRCYMLGELICKR